MFGRTLLLFLSIFFLLLLHPMKVWAVQSYYIKSLVVQGNNFVSTEFIKQASRITVPSLISPEQLDRAIKNLYNSDKFSQVKADITSGVLLLKVQENPIVENLVLEGNSQIKKENLLPLLLLGNHSIYSPRKLMLDVKTIRDQYLLRGYLQVMVSTKVVKLPHNRVNIVYNIDEHKKSYIADIIFLGNKSYSDSALTKVILSREHRWWKIFTTNDMYNASRIAYDRELLTQFYKRHGFFDFSILSSYVTLDKQNAFQLVFNLIEGTRYKYSSLTINTDLDDVKPYVKDLHKYLVTEGQGFNQQDVDVTIANITTYLNKLGFRSVDIEPKMALNPLLKTISIEYFIKNAPKKIVGHINIIGNTKTYESVIRRALSIREGDLFMADTVASTKNEIYNLGYFGSNVNVIPRPGSSFDKVDLDINVKEDSTGYISLTGGYSTYEGFMLQTSFAESNLFGSGNGLKATISWSQMSTNFDILLYDPYFMERNIYTSINLFDTATDNTSTRFYKLNNLGTRLSLGYKLSDNLTETFSYNISQERIYGVSDDAPIFIKESSGSRISSIVTHSLQYDRRDNVIYTKKGYNLILDTDIAGLGGDVYYLRNTLHATAYQQIFKDIILSLDSTTGYIGKLRKDHPILVSDMFFLGGSDLRGFAYSGIGPRDEHSGGALGGNFTVRLSAQLDIPVPIVNNYGLIFHFFNDNGTVYNVDKVDTATLKSSMYIRSSVGFGLSWRSPFGLIALDWGWPVRKQPQDITQRFLLSFGTRI